ncbi:resistin-like beta isoform X1 [Monodelphis domestica]|uniref:resistin-like beta isoform X1 n=2 Tax=Monodelphis domestica TaxID=13616 RepID=UPI0024E1C7B4|nr:resistin-like beta isoform X1 [Monodelphis domestica]
MTHINLLPIRLYPALPRTQPSNKMKPAFFLLLILIPLLALMSPGHADCALDSIVDKKIKESLTSLELGFQARLTCTSVKSRGTLATCPAGFIVTGCACGYGCGSWDVRGDNVCHCQCLGMDWTSARCCQFSK